ncbi:hypothetical protein ACFQ8C_31665 [Streptomyces sp. NPDC056503]
MTRTRKPHPAGEEDEQQIRALHAQSLGRNEIARRTQRSGRCSPHPRG